LVGFAQGRQSIVDAVINIIYQTGRDLPNVGLPIAGLFAVYVQQEANPAFASYWEFGVLLAIGGFILVVRGDRKPKSAQES
jgi:hypothetical protein